MNSEFFWNKACLCFSLKGLHTVIYMGIKSQNLKILMIAFLTLPTSFWAFKGRGWVKKSIQTNCRLTTISSQISAIYMNIFHKTEVQTVILRYWTVLYINWLKNYDKNKKHAKKQKTQKLPKTVHMKIFFLQNRTKTEMEKIAFHVITFEPIKIQTHSVPQNDHLNFNFVKDIHVDGRNLARNSCKTAICQSTFFRDTLY